MARRLKRQSPSLGEGSDKRQILMAAARQIISDNPDKGLSMRALSLATKTSPTTIYDLFGSKGGLLLALMQEERAKYENTIKRIKTKSQLERPFYAVSSIIDMYRDNVQFHKSLTQEYFSMRGDDVREIIDPRRRDLLVGLVQSIKDGGYKFLLPPQTVAALFHKIYTDSLFRWSVDNASLQQFEMEMGLGFATILAGVLEDRGGDYLSSRISFYADGLQAANKAAEEGFD